LTKCLGIAVVEEAILIFLLSDSQMTSNHSPKPNLHASINIAQRAGSLAMGCRHTALKTQRVNYPIAKARGLPFQFSSRQLATRTVERRCVRLVDFSLVNSPVGSRNGRTCLSDLPAEVIVSRHTKGGKAALLPMPEGRGLRAAVVR